MFTLLIMVLDPYHHLQDTHQEQYTRLANKLLSIFL